MLGTDELHLFEPLGAAAPQAAHMFHELRKLGYKAAVGWVVHPPAVGDEAIYDAYMREAGDTGRTEAAIARLQRWRREHDVIWVSELFRADGVTLRGRFMFNPAARARRCEPDMPSGCVALRSGAAAGRRARASGRVWGYRPLRRGMSSASAATCSTTERSAASARKGALVRRSPCSPLTPRHGESQPERTSSSP